MEELLASIESFLLPLVAKYFWLATTLGVLGSAVTLASVIILLTKNKKDDEVLKKIKEHPIGGFFVTLIERFSLFAPKK